MFFQNTMTDQELETKLGELVLRERKITSEILHLICEVDSRRSYLEKGYSSLFDYLVRFFGYSESAAYRRIQASRILCALPQVEEKMISGEVNLTTLSQAQSIFQKEEKRSGKKISIASKTEVLKKIEGKSSTETQKALLQVFPDSVSQEESLRVISEDETKLTVILDEKTLALLKEAKDFLSHSLPNATWAEVIGVLADRFVTSKKKPAQIKNKPLTSAAVSLRVKPPLVFERARSQCEFKDRRTQKRCGSKLGTDHLD